MNKATKTLKILSGKLVKSKYYLVNLDTKEVDSKNPFDKLTKALDHISVEGLKNYTAIKGKEILSHLNVWKLK